MGFQKLVLKVDANDQKEKQKVLKAVSGLSGIDSLSMELKDQKLTVVGDVDPVEVVGKLRKKNWHAEIISVGPAKEAEKKKEDDKKKEDEKKKTEAEKIQEYWKNYYNHYPYIPQRYVIHSADEDPNSCVIC
ncbi:OLC1v1029850C1 [Oldenlandia corymbosa var. corymbosa]|uniref:OLC1v1029850C1 n=1 Tax=Oldenlandia corymbosa var. corymbosa TaxID=529605 RepID=A0AAV1CFF4_OLDCO|nr:OLC1v1029850C1 [Oldenlandia corymbosa var. corymbosa]